MSTPYKKRPSTPKPTVVTTEYIISRVVSNSSESQDRNNTVSTQTPESSSEHVSSSSHKSDKVPKLVRKLLLGSTLLFIGEALLIYGIRSPSWSVTVKEDEEIRVESHDAIQIKNSNYNSYNKTIKVKQRFLHSPWKACFEFKLNKVLKKHEEDPLAGGYGSCNEIFVRHNCANDDDNKEKCKQTTVVRIFANGGVLLGSIAAILAIMSTMNSNRFQKYTAVVSATTGLFGFVSFIVATSVYAVIHLNGHDRLEESVKADVAASLGIKIEDVSKSKLGEGRLKQKLKLQSLRVGNGFMMFILGGAFMLQGAVIVGYAALKGENKSKIYRGRFRMLRGRGERVYLARA